MARGTTSGVTHRPRGLRNAATRSVAGFLPLVAGVASAAALTGAAFFTVELASCADPGQYIRHDNHVEFVGGCVEGTNLPHTDPQQPGPAQPHSYRP